MVRFGYVDKFDGIKVIKSNKKLVNFRVVDLKKINDYYSLYLVANSITNF